MSWIARDRHRTAGCSSLVLIEGGFCRLVTNASSICASNLDCTRYSCRDGSSLPGAFHLDNLRVFRTGSISARSHDSANARVGPLGSISSFSKEFQDSEYGRHVHPWFSCLIYCASRRCSTLVEGISRNSRCNTKTRISKSDAIRNYARRWGCVCRSHG